MNDLDQPENFDTRNYLASPLAHLARSNGFVRLDRDEREERWVKTLNNRSEIWLRTQPDWDPEPIVFDDPTRGGRTWEMVLVKPEKHYILQIARCNELILNALLSAFFQRLATWPDHVPQSWLGRNLASSRPLP